MGVRSLVRSIGAAGFHPREARQIAWLSPDVRHLALETVASVKPPNLYRLAGTFGILTKHYAGLASRNALPDPEKALRWPDGLAGVCDELSAPTLRAAYARGLYPSSQIGPQTWWAPAMRMVLFIENFHIEQNVRRRLRHRDFRVTFDHDFGAVIRACARARAQRMGPGLIEAFMAAFLAGLAHSAEVWDRSGVLAGGIFGLAIGKVFFTEAQFARTRNASKVGFTALNCHLQRWGYLLNDGKHVSGQLSQLGFTPIPRNSFNALLAKACTKTGREGRWAMDESINLAGWNPKTTIAAR